MHRLVTKNIKALHLISQTKCHIWRQINTNLNIISLSFNYTPICFQTKYPFCLTELVFCILFDLMCGQSVRCQLVFGKFAEAAYCFAMLDFEHYSLTKAKVLCQMF